MSQNVDMYFEPCGSNKVFIFVKFSTFMFSGASIVAVVSLFFAMVSSTTSYAAAVVLMDNSTSGVYCLASDWLTTGS